MFIAVNKVAAPSASAAQQQAMLEAFEKAAPDMKRFQGFLGLEMWTAQDNTMLAVSRWESKEALDDYLSHGMFGQHHSGASAEQMQRGDQVTYYTSKTVV